MVGLREMQKLAERGPVFFTIQVGMLVFRSVSEGRMIALRTL